MSTSAASKATAIRTVVFMFIPPQQLGMGARSGNSMSTFAYPPFKSLFRQREGLRLGTACREPTIPTETTLVSH